MTRIIIGAANTHYEGWTATNVAQLNLLRPDDWHKYAPVEMALAEHVWEHLTPEQGKQAAAYCALYVPNLRVAVPDGNFPDDAYVARARLGECEGDHLAIYTHTTLTAIFEAAGYDVTLLEWWEHGVFHYRPWDTTEGMVFRSLRYDARNSGGAIGYTSLILDARRRA